MSSASSNKRSGWTTGAIPFGGRFIAGIGFDAPTAGGGLKGYMPPPIINHANDASFGRTRFTLRDAWNGNAYNNKSVRIQTPFRAVMNAGDTLSRKDYACQGGSCQSVQSRPGVHGLSNRLGSSNGTCRPSVFYSPHQLNVGIPAGTCNGKFVYDSSDYTTYLKRRASTKNYNDRAFGGNESSGAQSKIRAIRH